MAQSKIFKDIKDILFEAGTNRSALNEHDRNHLARTLEYYCQLNSQEVIFNNLDKIGEIKENKKNAFIHKTLKQWNNDIKKNSGVDVYGEILKAWENKQDKQKTDVENRQDY